MLDTIVTLPDGSQGTLNDFYDGIMDESIKTTDAGYVLSDGTVLSTNGEPMWNPSAEYLYQLMSPYIEGATPKEISAEEVLNADDGEVQTYSSVTKTPFYKKPIGLISIGFLAYMIYKKAK